MGGKSEGSVSVIVSARRFRGGTYGIKVDLDAADVGRANGNHAEKAIAPSAEECDALVEHK